jgi:DNA-binding Lrp family transcriptional regulator
LVKKNTVNWRIYKLLEKGIIQRIGRGKYRLGKHRGFNPLINKTIKNLYAILKKEYPYLDISIWSTEWISQWMLHVPGINKIIIEVEKGTEDSVFYFLSDIRKNVFINPTRDILDKYTHENKDQIIIKNLITDAPLQKINNLQIPAIEKILVDLILDVKTFPEYQGRDLESIIDNIYQFHSVQEDKLLRYANRRGKRDFIKQFIKNLI